MPLARKFFLPSNPELMTYDADGNLTSDGRWNYTYDAENRLISMETKPNLLSPTGPMLAADAKRLEFTYDYMGRRVEKLVRSGFNGTAYAAVTRTRFIYEGWNLASEYTTIISGSTTTLTLSKTFTWGLDWSGTLQGAGGVGGLQFIRDHSAGASYFPVYDGNGNIMGLVNTTGAFSALYEYDAFGQTLRAEGTAANANPFRFSTKFTDGETGLVYYGLRYYSPSLGRFVNRDPIGETGGRNLYHFTSNRPLDRWDFLGLNVQEMDGGGSQDDPPVILPPFPVRASRILDIGLDILHIIFILQTRIVFNNSTDGGGGEDPDLVVLDPFVVRGDKVPNTPTTPTTPSTPVTPNEGGAAPNKPEQWSKEKCAELAAKIQRYESAIQKSQNQIASLAGSNPGSLPWVEGIQALGDLSDVTQKFSTDYAGFLQTTRFGAGVGGAQMTLIPALSMAANAMEIHDALLKMNAGQSGYGTQLVGGLAGIANASIQILGSGSQTFARVTPITSGVSLGVAAAYGIYSYSAYRTEMQGIAKTIDMHIQSVSNNTHEAISMSKDYMTHCGSN